MTIEVETAKADWAEVSVEKACTTAHVPTAASTALTEQLKGAMRDRSLRASELTQFAKSILALQDTPSTEVAK